MTKAALIVAAIIAQFVVIGLAMVAEEQSAKHNKFKAELQPGVLPPSGTGSAVGALIVACRAMWFAYAAGAEA